MTPSPDTMDFDSTSSPEGLLGTDDFALDVDLGKFVLKQLIQMIVNH